MRPGVLADDGDSRALEIGAHVTLRWVRAGPRDTTAQNSFKMMSNSSWSPSTGFTSLRSA